MTATDESSRARADKRLAILAAALDLFAKYGYRRTSIDDVARAAGIAKGSVYLHFPGKRELFRAGCEAVLADVLGKVEAVRKKPGPVRERVLALLEAKFAHLHDLVGSSPHAPEILDTTTGLAADIVERADKRFLDALAEVLADGDERGELALARLHLSPAQAAGVVFRCAEGTTQAPNMAAKTYRKRLQQLVDVLLQGLGS
ncbi:MAG TPA: TetR/AcrR family transcriptional regulator [Nannocystaceae bacterium]|nr:TetR/AcrR family transcriptional regulator [Nannocystaceae bacterium]